MHRPRFSPRSWLLIITALVVSAWLASAFARTRIVLERNAWAEVGHGAISFKLPETPHLDLEQRVYIPPGSWRTEVAWPFTRRQWVGEVHTKAEPARYRDGWIEPPMPTLQLCPDASRHPHGSFYACIPLWLLAVPTGVAWGASLARDRWRRRRAARGRCIRCGYALHGLSHNSPCPECNTLPT